MASRHSDTMNSNTYLTPGQEDLLTAALNSNKHGRQGSQSNNNNNTSSWINSIDTGLDSILYPHIPGSAGTMNEYGVNFLKGADDLDLSLDSIDAGADFDDGSDDYSPVNESAEPHEKRQRPDDDKDQDDATSKRQEGTEKVPKKPGRKPLTVEPTNKRKAQNRAAQRAFRERKEKHLKDMETRVEELEKASEAANSENGVLKARIERLQTELRDYKKRLSLNSSSFSQSNPMSNQLSMFLASNNNAANNTFNLDFPQFGSLPNGSNNLLGNNTDLATSPTSITPPVNGRQSSIGAAMVANGANGRSASPQNQGRLSMSRSNAAPVTASRQNSNNVQIESINNDVLTGLFGSVSPGATPASQPTQTLRQNSTSSSSATTYPNRIFQFNSNAASTASPSASSNSQYGEQSSCATSPEATTDSPALRNKDSIAETTNQASPFMGLTSSLSPASFRNSASPSTTNLDSTSQPLKGIDWYAAQNGGQFDPTLFGNDYRESQLNIIGDGDFTGGFFENALTSDYNSPSNWFNFGNLPTGFTPAVQKANPLEQADLLSAGIDAGVTPVQSTENKAGCDALWSQLSQRKDVQDGSFDIDGLCEELKKKATCQGGGVVIAQKDIDDALKRRQTQNPFAM